MLESPSWPGDTGQAPDPKDRGPCASREREHAGSSTPLHGLLLFWMLDVCRDGDQPLGPHPAPQRQREPSVGRKEHRGHFVQSLGQNRTLFDEHPWEAVLQLRASQGSPGAAGHAEKFLAEPKATSLGLLPFCHCSLVCSSTKHTCCLTRKSFQWLAVALICPKFPELSMETAPHHSCAPVHPSPHGLLSRGLLAVPGSPSWCPWPDVASSATSLPVSLLFP